MCENNKNDEGSDGKTSQLNPVFSQIPKGVSKIFILTPEILKTLGITGPMSIRKGRLDSVKSINSNILTVQQSPTVKESESNATFVKIVQHENAATSDPSNLRKRKRNSITESSEDKEPNETSITIHTSKTLMENPLESEQRMNGLKPKVSVANNNKEESSCTPKTKKIKKRNVAANIQDDRLRSQEGIAKNLEKASKDESENPAPGVRSSRRVSIPKKFDDYIVTDNIVHKASTRESSKESPKPVKRQSRKSSASSTKTKPTTHPLDNVDNTKIGTSKKSNKKEVGRETMVESMKSVKPIETKSPSSEMRSLSARETCATVPETQMCVDKSKIVKTYERRCSLDQKETKVGDITKAQSDNESETVPRSLGTSVSSSTPKILFPANQRHIKIVKTYRIPKIQKITRNPVVLEDKSTREVETGLAVPKQDGPMAKTIESNVSKIQVVKIYGRSKGKAKISQQPVKPKDVKESLEKVQQDPVNSEMTETGEIVSEVKIDASETVESQSFLNPGDVKFSMESPHYPNNEEESNILKADLLVSWNNVEDAGVFETELPECLSGKEVSVSKPPIRRDKSESITLKSHLPRSPDETMSREEKKESIIVKPIPRMSIHENELSFSKPNLPMFRDDNENSSISKPAPHISLREKEVRASEPEIPMSRGTNEKSASIAKPPRFSTNNKVDEKPASFTKTKTPRLLNEKAISAVSSPNPTISPDEKKISGSKLDTSTPSNKKAITIVNLVTSMSSDENTFAEPKSSDEKIISAVSDISVLSTVEKTISVSEPDVSRLLNEKPIEASKQDTSMVPDEKPIIFAKPDTPRLLYEKPIKASQQDTLMVPDEKPIIFAKPDTPQTTSRLKTGTVKLKISRFFNKKVIGIAKLDKTRSQNKIAVDCSKTDTLMSSDMPPHKKEISDSKPKLPRLLSRKKISVLKPNIRISLNKKVIGNVKLDTARSQHKTAVDYSKEDVPRALGKEEIVASKMDTLGSSDISSDKQNVNDSKPEALISTDKPKVNNSELETPYSENEQVCSMKTKIPSSPDETEVGSSKPETPNSPAETKVGVPETQSCPDETEVCASILERPSCPDETEIDPPKSETLSCPDETKAGAPKQDTLNSSDTNAINAPASEISNSLDEKEVSVLEQEIPSAPEKTDVAVSIPKILNSLDKTEVGPTNPEITSSLVETEVLHSKPEIPSIPGEKEVIGMNTDTEKQVEHSVRYIFEDDATNTITINSDSNIEISSMDAPSFYIDDVDSTNYSVAEEFIAEAIVGETSLPAEDTPDTSEKVCEMPEVRVPRKRGRPRNQPLSIEVSPEENMQIEEANHGAMSIDASMVENACRAKKPVQRNENEIDGKGLSEDSEDESPKDEVVLRPRRGRPVNSRGRGKKRGRCRGPGRGRVDFEYVPRERSSNTKNPENSDHVDDSQQEEVADAPKVDELKCGKCKKIVPKKSWPDHNMLTHNNMGWLDGEEEPDFANNEKLLRSVLAAVVKKKKKKACFTCETCGDEKRSAIGFISHLQFCGKTEEERQALLMTCPTCGNVMMPSSMEMHERYHRQVEKAIEKEAKENSINHGHGREKRKAAEKAATKIAEFTDLVKEDEPVPKKRRRNIHELAHLIECPRDLTNPPNRWRGIWKSEINVKGKALCRQPGCNVTCDSIEAMLEHNSNCPCIPKMYFICKICKFSSEIEREVMKHVKAKHNEDVALLDDSDFKDEDNSSSSEYDSDQTDDKLRRSGGASQKSGHERYQRQITNVKFLDEEVQIDPKIHLSYSPAIGWTMEFECKNYRLRLFEDLSPNVMRLLNNEENLEYLPQLMKSMRIKETKKQTGNNSTGWISWQRFEAGISDGIPTLFAGGPIWAVAWLPIPVPLYNHDVDQYVAVSTHPTMESAYVVGKSYVEKNIIQIWNLGHLDHSRENDKTEPIFSYGVAHDKGTIWCLEWCPSGCYEHPSFFDDPETDKERKHHRRMGLLAAACSDGCVHIFSLPFPDELNFTKSDEDTSESLPIYETKPIITLVASTKIYEKGQQKWQCTKLNWSRELGHDTIIAGFSNGYVAMWDITSESPLCVTKHGETTFIDAFHHFYAHGHAISSVKLIPYGDKRFFMTSSYDRLTKVWDLEDTSYPLSTTKRGIAMDGAWLTHWPAYLTAYDDVTVHGHTYLMALRQPGVKVFPLLPTNSTTPSVDVSDYGNSIGHGTLAGEVLVMFPHHLWNLRDMERDVPRKRWLASSTSIVEFSGKESENEKGVKASMKKKNGKEYVYMPETYDECKDRYGIVFHDTLTRSKHDGCRNSTRPPCSERLTPVNIEQYPFASVNRVSWNPNAWSYLWMCVGYQNGLVRFLNFNTVAVDQELRQLLPSHVESMLEESRRSLKSEKSAINTDSSHTRDS